MNAAPHGLAPASGRARTLVRWALGAVFLAAGSLKVLRPELFYTQLLAYDTGLPDGLLRLVTVTLPWLEALCGGALLARIWPETVGVMVAFLCLIFVVMLGQAVLRGLDLSCGCFGSALPSWFDHPAVALARAGALLAGALWLVAEKRPAA